MASIIINSLTFYYSSARDLIFENLSLDLSTDWKLGLIGRNGKGKTTLLKLIHKEIEPVKGEISVDADTYYFPYIPVSSAKTVLETIKDIIAPFRKWENEMKKLLDAGDEESLKQYGLIFEQFQALDGFRIEASIEKEVKEIGLDTNLLSRKYNTLSGGEQTRALLISLFLKKNAFMLIDEPTNHLDLKGRIMLGEYLSGKKGYILVSHDRYFLDLCIDHILSLNKSDAKLIKGNYSQWKYEAELKEKFEMKKKENLTREVKSLDAAAVKRRKWSDQKEKEKQGAHDKGFIGHQSAKLMKRARVIESRITGKLEEKKSLLRNYEKKRVLKLNTGQGKGNLLAYLDNVSLRFGSKNILENFSMTLYQGDSLAVIGCNGCGKTTLLKLLKGDIKPDSGSVYMLSRISVSYAGQVPLWKNGYLRDYLYEFKIDESKFRTILAVLGSGGEIFERPLETFSKGEIKKVELCRSFIKPYDLLLWDEPLNYLDTMSREQIEDVLLKNKPTIIFTEHDLAFIENVADKIISLD